MENKTLVVKEKTAQIVQVAKTVYENEYKQINVRSFKENFKLLMENYSLQPTKRTGK